MSIPKTSATSDPSTVFHAPTRSVLIISITGIILVVVVGLLIKTNTAESVIVSALNAQHAPLLDAIGVFALHVVGPAAAVAIGLAVAVVIAFKTRSLATGLGVSAAIAASWVSSAMVKLLVERPRPSWDLLAQHVGPMEIDPSYPSGHVTFIASLTVVLALYLWRSRYRTLAILLGTIATLVIAFGRIYVGAHYPSDIVAAIVYSIFASLLACGAVAWFAKRTTVLQRIDAIGARRQR